MNLINNIKKFIVYKNKILTINNNNVFSDQAKNIQLFDSPVNGFIQFNNKIYINDWSGKYFILDANLNILENGDGKGFYFSSSNYFGCQYLNEFGLNEALIDKNSNAIEFGILNKDSSLNYSTQSFFYFIKENYLHTYTIPTATPLWQFYLGSFGEYVNDWGEKFPYEVEQFIGVLGSNLLVLLNQKELLALEIHSGKINQRLQYVDSLEGDSVLALDEKNKLKYYNTNYFVEEEKNIVYALFEDVLFEINAAQPTITTTAYGLKNEYDKYQINPYKVSSKTFYYDQKIYFLDQEQGRFGILDLPTRSIVYVSDPIVILGEGLGFDKLKEIQVAENKVYVLDKTNTLHIFEKE